MLAIEYTKAARKALEAMPANVRRLVVAKIEELAIDPARQHNNVTRLKGRPEFRLRVQDWRVIYRIVDDRLVLLILKIGARGGVYK